MVNAIVAIMVLFFFDSTDQTKTAMRKFDKGWLITGVIILLVCLVWFITFKDGRRILRQTEKEPVPYYSEESGEDEETNP